MRHPRGSVRYGDAYATPVPLPDDEEGASSVAAADGDAGAHRDMVRCRGLERARPRPGSCGSRLAPAIPTMPGSMQAGIGYGDIGDHAGGLGWLTTGLELALRTGDPESALEQLRPLRASCLSALGRPSEEIQKRTAQGNTGER
jgi:hypothetical protein